MPKLEGFDAVVVGGGAAGLCTALTLVRHGARVTLYEPGAAAEASSGVAAGMLAPAFEAALDLVSADCFELFRAGRDLWPELMRSLGLAAKLQRAGALRLAFSADEVELDLLAERLRILGAPAERLDAKATRGLAPGLAAGVSGSVFTPEDWSLPPRLALRALAQAFSREGGRTESLEVKADAQGRLRADGRDLAGDAIVLAPGAGAKAFAAAAPEIAALSPIKGQLLAFAGPPATGPTIRSAAGYVVPQPEGAIAGATMEAGVDDRRLDSAKLATLRAEAVRVFPHLDRTPAEGRAGVRSATPDGLPLAGPSRRPGVWLATGMRRNGWLLAPLVAEMLTARLAGQGGGPFASLLDPARLAGAWSA